MTRIVFLRPLIGLVAVALFDLGVLCLGSPWHGLRPFVVTLYWGRSLPEALNPGFTYEPHESVRNLWFLLFMAGWLGALSKSAISKRVNRGIVS